MNIIKQNAVVYLAPTARRRYLTATGAASAEAKAMIRSRYPTEEFEPDTGHSFHWTQLPRPSVMYRRLTKKIINNMKASNI